MNEQGIFRGRTVVILIAVGLLAFAGTIVAALIAGGDPAVTAGANSFSRSAIGHHAFVELLRERDVPVVVSRLESASRSGDHELLVVAEPPPLAQNDPTIEAMLDVPKVLYVLPKWTGRADVERQGWLKYATMLPRVHVQEALERIDPDAQVVRPQAARGWIGANPALPRPQLIQSVRIKPVVNSPHGILIGRIDRGWAGSAIWVVSDPDLLSNHGIGLGDNARIVADLVDRARDGGAVIIDETLHGFRLDPSLLRSMFRLPLLAVTLPALVAIAVLGWMAAGRFGAPLAANLLAGQEKTDLIHNTALLLVHGGHGGDILQRYRGAVLRDVLRRLKPPRALRGEALTDWLDRLGKARGVGASYAALSREVDQLSDEVRVDRWRLTRIAFNLHRWKQEMTHGS